MKRFLSTSKTLAATSIPKNAHSGTKYAGRHTVTLIPGDGIGPEISSGMKEVFGAAGVPIEWDEHSLSGFSSAQDNEEKLKAAVDSLKRNKVGIKGILFTPVSKTASKSINVAMRKDLDIYASVSLVQNIPGLDSRHSNVDIAIIRENTEGEYSGLEHQSFPGVVESLKVITAEKSERIARFAFDFALQNNRRKVTCVHKANIMKLGDGLFLNSCKKVAKLYESTGIEFEAMIVDNTAMQLVANPQQFDVMVMPNLYGSIMSNVGAGLVGSPGLIPGANIGSEFAVFEPGCRHVGQDLAGKNVANPTGMISSGILLLRHLGLDEHANRISEALLTVTQDGTSLTPDVGGSSTTTDYVQAIVKAIK